MATLGTEEDLRARVIAYLGTLGIGPSQLRFEGLVRLQLGRVPVDLGVDPDVRMERHGHYDILVTNQSGRNLLVAELKRPGLALTEDDAKQAVSYARLLMQMPPFAWLTNGIESHLYDVWSAKEVTPDNLVGTWSEDAWNPQFSQEDLRLREEALRFFIGYSQENVTLFCRAQQTLRMANLRGDPGTRTRKYLPEVYVPRRSVRRSFAEFLASPAAVFVLAGPSGIGKTNELCALAEESGAAHLSLFFSGGELASAPGAVLADEFSWSFSDQLSLPLLCERLASIARASCRNVLIFLDAIDECEVQLFEKLAADLAFHFAKYAGVIRLVVSLKTTQWERFAHFADGPSSLARLCFREAPAGSERSEQPGRRWGVPSVELVPLEPDESAEAISRYATCFGLRGRFGRGMEDRVRDPFELRIASLDFHAPELS